MSTIKISDLHSTGAELFSDSESYMNELSEGVIGTIQGGFSSWKCVRVSARFSVVSAVVSASVALTAGEAK